MRRQFDTTKVQREKMFLIIQGINREGFEINSAPTYPVINFLIL